MRQNDIAPAPGSRKKSKRVGRGDASGHGSFSGRGCKGQKARAGNNKVRPGFEGGQLPMIKRLPQKRGFYNLFRTEYSVVNVGQLSAFESGAEVTPEGLFAAGLVKAEGLPVKILGEGELKSSLVVKAHKFSATAKNKIEAAGGRVEEMGHAAAAAD